ncbi:molybdopterin molybdotransferase MoeA [Dyella sp. 20L07]|uniref:molybdopterin molybdotransferase MoeA n=1 Tax=Dyella sp. 20L07 TaxID=3384240 RepID=UPI003D2ADEF7
MTELISVVEADARIAQRTPRFGTVQVPLDQAAGRILRQTVVAGHDHPPFDRVMMDGIAIRWSESVPRALSVTGTQLAGMTGGTLGTINEACIEVATGAMLPSGSDCVIPIEQTWQDGSRYLLTDDCRPMHKQFIHPRGADCLAGSLLLEEGVRLGAPEMALLASNGITQVRVAATPSIAILSTGDELLPVDAPILGEGLIRRSNDIAIATALRMHGLDRVVCEHVDDDFEATKAALARLLNAHDALILSGGVSKGKRDHVPAALEALGVQRVFHRIAQRPGKPMWFGIGPGRQMVFALPGNPVSALVCAVRYARPTLLVAQGVSMPPPMQVVLAGAVDTSESLTCFVPAALQSDAEGRQMADLVPARTSGDFTALPHTHGVVELPAMAGQLPAGSVVIFHRW